MISTVEIENIKKIDLVEVIERDTNQERKKVGKSVMFRCPFHDDHVPSLGVMRGENGWFWKCFGCGKHGDLIGWKMTFRNIGFMEACKELGMMEKDSEKLAGSLSNNQVIPIGKGPRGDKWQGRALELIERAEDYLWSKKGWFDEVNWVKRGKGKVILEEKRLSPVDWLMSRGLSEKTLKTWRVGFIPVSFEDRGEKWGLENKSVKIGPGVLIPCIFNESVWYLKIRMLDPIEKKFTQVLGSVPGLFMAQTLDFGGDVFFTEGEFDSMLLYQESGRLVNPVGVVTLGAAGNQFDVYHWGLFLLGKERFFIAYDADEAGEGGVKNLAWLHGAQRVTMPNIREGDKDITDFFLSGGDLAGWVSNYIGAGKG